MQTTEKQRMALFEKGNKNGNRFTSDNQPPNRGRKPKLYKKLKELVGQTVGHELEKEDYSNVIRFLMERSPKELERLIKDEHNQPNKETHIWVLNIVSAINSDIRYGRTSTIEMIFDRIFGKSTQPIESEVNAQVTNNNVDLSALNTEELLQYNALLEKISKGNDGKK